MTKAPFLVFAIFRTKSSQHGSSFVNILAERTCIRQSCLASYLWLFYKALLLHLECDCWETCFVVLPEGLIMCILVKL